MELLVDVFKDIYVYITTLQKGCRRLGYFNTVPKWVPCWSQKDHNPNYPSETLQVHGANKTIRISKKIPKSNLSQRHQGIFWSLVSPLFTSRGQKFLRKFINFWALRKNEAFENCGEIFIHYSGAAAASFFQQNCKTFIIRHLGLGLEDDGGEIRCKSEKRKTF